MNVLKPDGLWYLLAGAVLGSRPSEAGPNCILLRCKWVSGKLERQEGLTSRVSRHASSSPYSGCEASSLFSGVHRTFLVTEAFPNPEKIQMSCTCKVGPSGCEPATWHIQTCYSSARIDLRAKIPLYCAGRSMDSLEMCLFSCIRRKSRICPSASKLFSRNWKIAFVSPLSISLTSW